ncbi:hypothetical protein OEZ86_010147 [Tetradesmus obliquus]|nr:hypothetical protein OEZ86_010147 [Tetradesmus obliquus]
MLKASTPAVIYLVLQGTSVKAPALVTLAHVAPYTAASLVLPMLMVEGHALVTTYAAWRPALPAVILSGLFATTLNLVVFQLVRLTSALTTSLSGVIKESSGWLVHGYDRDPRGLASRVWQLAALDIPDSTLAQYDAFVYLGGYTGRVMCDGDPAKCITENVDEVVAFAKRLQPRQLLVFASTSAIAEGSGADLQKEDGPVREALLDSYSSSMSKREQALKQLGTNNPAAPQLIGTRFGTVVGLSPSQRTDLIHMALVCSAYGSGRLKISSPETHRALLAMDDLVVALHKILLQPQRAGRRCHHAQLSYLVDRERLFLNYQYQSGTSSTLAKHFETIVDKVVQGTGKQQGTVLEIASNDGTQLDKFKAQGWKTYGVDPAKNLVKLAAAKGHNAIAAFWGQGRIAGLPAPNTLDAIVAQNVFAHVFRPVEFLDACAAVMGPNTLLYIQTSQCEMFQSGQFDTVYHEHVSFFSAHSFQWAAKAAGLSITNIDIVPIHGRSCLVTFKKGKQLPAASLQQYMSMEIDTGMTQDWFYKQFGSRAVALRDWMNGMLAQMAAQGFTLGAYGAAAKGMVLLHYLKSSPASKAYEFEFVVDDAPLKQNTFCPGTSIPVKPTAYLKTLKADKPLVLVIFAWNFEEEIISKVRSTMAGTGNSKVLAIVPFPTQRVIEIHLGSGQQAVTELLTNPAVPLQWPGVVASNMRCPVVGVSHFYNEEFLLPFFIRHHAAVFDSMLLIDYASTDRSVELLKAEMPASWQVVRSANKDFNAVAVDAEVRRYERSFPACAWKIALTTTEFLVHPNMRGMVAELDGNLTTEVIQFPYHVMVGDDSKPFSNHSQLAVQRTQYGASLAGK